MATTALAKIKDNGMSKNVVVHLSPVWRNQSNYIIFGMIEGTEPLPKSWEQLWAKQVSENLFEICCIPFFIYDLALGDQVQTKEFADKKYVIQKVTRRSGRRTVRVHFKKDPGKKDELISYVMKEGCLPEWYSQNLLAIDADSSKKFEKLVKFLEEFADGSTVNFEVGC